MTTWLLVALGSIPLTYTITLPSLMSWHYLNKEGETYGWPRAKDCPPAHLY